MILSDKLFTDPQLDPGLPEPHSDAMSQLGYVLHEVPKADDGIVFITPRLGYTVDIDVEPKPGQLFNDRPQSGIIQFAYELGIANQDLLTPWPYNHTNKVIVVSGPKDMVFIADEGRSVPYGPTNEDPFFDGIIVPKNEYTKDMVLAFTGADCVPIVGHAKTYDGNEVMFGIHAGRKGVLTGVVENTINQLIQMGVDTSTIVATVGAGAQAIELPVSIIDAELSENPNLFTCQKLGRNAMDKLDNSVISVYSSLLDREAGHSESITTKALLDVQLEAAYRLAIRLAGKGVLYCVEANTITDDRFKSYRGFTMATKNGDSDLAEKKSGRNMTFVRF